MNDLRAPSIYIGGRPTPIAPARRLRKLRSNTRAIVGSIGAHPKPEKFGLPAGRPVLHKKSRV